jgi:hypothetical protein
MRGRITLGSRALFLAPPRFLIAHIRHLGQPRGDLGDRFLDFLACEEKEM